MSLTKVTPANVFWKSMLFSIVLCCVECPAIPIWLFIIMDKCALSMLAPV